MRVHVPQPRYQKFAARIDRLSGPGYPERGDAANSMYAAISDEDRYVFLFPCARYIYYIDVSEHQPWRVWGLCGSAKRGTESYEEERFANDPLLRACHGSGQCEGARAYAQIHRHILQHLPNRPKTPRKYRSRDWPF
jgi:hypothetical protein